MVRHPTSHYKHSKHLHFVYYFVSNDSIKFRQHFPFVPCIVHKCVYAGNKKEKLGRNFMNRLRRSSIQNVNSYCVHNLSNTGTNPTNIVPDEYKWSFFEKNDYLYNDHVQHSSDGAKNSLRDICRLTCAHFTQKYSFTHCSHLYINFTHLFDVLRINLGLV